MNEQFKSIIYFVAFKAADKAAADEKARKGDPNAESHKKVLDDRSRHLNPEDKGKK